MYKITKETDSVSKTLSNKLVIFYYKFIFTNVLNNKILKVA